MMNCEVLLMLGTDFPYQDFYPKDATIVQIDVRGEHLGRRSKLDFGFIGDTKTTINEAEFLVPVERAKRKLDELRPGYIRPDGHV